MQHIVNETERAGSVTAVTRGSENLKKMVSHWEINGMEEVCGTVGVSNHPPSNHHAPV